MLDFIGIIVPEADDGGACNDFVCEFGHCSFQREIWQEIQNQRIILIICSILCRIRFLTRFFFCSIFIHLLLVECFFLDHRVCTETIHVCIARNVLWDESLWSLRHYFDFLFLFSRRWVQKMKKSSQSRIQSSWGNIWKNSISVCMIFQVCILFPFLCEFDAFVRL